LRKRGGKHLVHGGENCQNMIATKKEATIFAAKIEGPVYGIFYNL